MNKTYKIHSFYILTILISIIIILITVKWGEFENLVNLISFALTISSLVLAILAIIYAVYSNNSFSTNITKLDSSSEKINNSATIVSNLSNTLLEKIDKIPILLSSIEQKTDANQVLLSKLNNPVNSKPDNHFDANNVDLENFVYKNSMSGQTLLYILYLSLKTKKKFSLKEICDKYSYGFDYYNGFLVAVTTLKVINYKLEYKNGDFTYEILEMNSYVKENIIKVIEEAKSKKDIVSEDDDKTKLSNSFKKNINHLEEFFK
jgi:hypothetical protein